MFNKIKVFKPKENNTGIKKLLNERSGEWFVYTEHNPYTGSYPNPFYRVILSQVVFHTALIKHIKDKTVYMVDGSVFTLSENSIEDLISVLKKHEAINQQIIKNKVMNNNEQI